MALAVEYDGTAYCGWQRQPHCHSVQAELESALGRIVRHPVTVHCAGRTDTGVHAAAQVVHFDTPAVRPLRAFTFGTNSHLAADVAVRWAGTVESGFHARHSALGRSYRYTILNRSCRPGLDHRRLAWEKMPLDAERMDRALAALIGEHDFTSFRSAECQARHAIRRITAASVVRDGDRVRFDVAANGFLHNMVRILTGCLLRIGRGDRPVHWLAELLEQRDRRLAGMTAPARGLTFVAARYPDTFGIPDFSMASVAGSAF